VGAAFNNLLSVVTFLPLVGALVMLFIPDGKMGRGIALWTSLLTFVVSLGLLAGFDTASTAAFQFEVNVPWAESIGIGYHIGIDGVSLLLILLTTFMMPIVIYAAGSGITTRIKEFAIAILVLETAMVGAFIALDLVLFYVFWELMLIPMFLIIGVWGSENRIYAAVKFFIYTMVGSFLMLLAILYLFWMTGEGGGDRSFDYLAFRALEIAPSVQVWLFLAFAFAFAVKVPMFPLHTWLPDAHVQAPAAGSVVLAAVMLKMGTYGFYRFAFPLFPAAAFELRWLLIALSVIGIIYGSLMCMAQRDMKKLVAYSSVAHLGFVMLGLTAFTTAGAKGAVYQMLNHGVSTGALFLLIGMLYERRHTRLIGDYGGIAKVIPAFAVIWMIVTLSSIGLPGTNGFVGEFLILSGTFFSKVPNSMVWGTLATSGVVLGAVYMLWMYQRLWHGKVLKPENQKIQDLSLREWMILSPLVVLIFVMGLFPGPFLEIAGPSVDRFISQMEQHNSELAGDPPPSIYAGKAKTADAGAPAGDMAAAAAVAPGRGRLLDPGVIHLDPAAIPSNGRLPRAVLPQGDGDLQRALPPPAQK